MKQLLTVLFLMSFALSCFSQCECTDCPVFVPNNTTVTSTLNISGSTNPTLASNGQSLCQICMDFTTDAIDELNVSLQSPSGSSVLLFSNTGVSTNQGINFDICFVSCIDTPIPDAGFPNNFATDEAWQSGGSYSGSYYPENACLEDFNGDINGDWVLTLTDNIFLDPSNLLDWYLVFSDDSGLSCANAANCSIASTCLAEGGNIDEISILEEVGSPNLNLSLTTTYAAGESPAPSSDYTYYYLVFSEAPTSELIAVLTSPDLTGFSTGEYQVYGLSILDSEFSSFPLPNTGVTISNILNDITNETYCADLDDTGVIVTIDDCLANGGTLESASITAPQGDPSLITSWLVDFSGTNTPPAPAYGLQYIVLEAGTDNIVAYLPNQDFTTLPPGMYQITVLSYLVSDSPLLPPPGNGAFLDLINLINANSICAIYFGLNDVNITFNCQAEGGLLSGAGYIYCVNDPLLDLSFPPVYNGGNVEPSAADYSYVYVVSQNGVVIDFDMNTDYTLYAPGTYEVCGLSYLNTDASLLPVANGVLTINDIQLDIDNDLYCADISDNCVSIFIQPEPDPLFIGAETVCAGEEYIYTNVNFDPDAVYLYNIQSGSFSQFIPSGDGTSVSVIWNAGFPGVICLIEQSSACGNEQSCINVTVNGGGANVNIDGETNVCIDATEVYTLTPLPTSGQQYTATIMGGTIISIIDDQVTVQWDDTATGELCVTLDDPACSSTPVCISITKIPEVTIPPFSLPFVNCLNTDIVLLTDNTAGDILNFNWSATNATITNANNDFVTISLDQLGSFEICLEIETVCGFQGPICETSEVFEVPTPIIDPTTEYCGLTITMNATPYDAGNTWFWSSVGAGPSITYSDQTNYTTDITFASPGTYTLNLQEFSSTCDGLDQIEITVTDGLDISPESFSCNLNNEYEVSFDILSGNAPFAVDGLSIGGTSFTSLPIPSGTSYSYQVEDIDGCTSTVSGVFNCPCISDAGTMSPTTLEACGPYNSSVTATSNGDETLDADDIGQYYLHDASGASLGNIFDSNATGIFTYVAPMVYGQTYYISYVVGTEISGSPDLNDPCLDVALGQPVIFYDTPSLDPYTTVLECGLSHIANLVGSSDITLINWSAVPGQNTSTFSNSQSLSTTISVVTPGQYTYNIEIDNGFCSDILIYEVEFLGDPTIQFPVEDCDPLSPEYVVTFELSNATPPFAANIPGSFNGNIFTSDPIPSGVSYNIQVTDSAGCLSNELQGVKLCDCISEAGTMPQNTINACGGLESINVLSNQDYVLDSDDAFIYILHTNSGTTIGDIKDTNTTGIFTFDPSSMVLDQLYYVSLAVANELAPSIDFNDLCLDIASGQPVIWNSFPTIDLPEDYDICESSTTLNASPTSGTWSILNQPLNADALLQNASLYNSEITLDSTGSYMLSWTSSNQGCTSIDTLIITKNKTPALANIINECNDDLLSYTLSLDIVGSSLNYDINGQVYNNQVVIEDIPVDQLDTFNITNDSGCVLTYISGPIDCSCVSDAGTVVSTDTITLCTGDVLNADISVGDNILDDDDTISYVLLDANIADPNNIIFQTNNTDISYDPSWQQYDILYLSVIVGDSISGSIDLDDNCLSFSTLVPVQWTQSSVISFNETRTACTGTQVNINPIGDSQYPVELSLINQNNIEENFTLLSVSDSISLTATAGQQTWTLTDISYNCVTSIDGTISVFGQDPTMISFVDDANACNNPLFNSDIVLAELFDGSPIDGEWSSTNIPIENGLLLCENIPAGIYAITFSTIGYENPCEGSTYQVSVTVNDCSCPEINLVDNINACNSYGTIDLYNQDFDGLEIEWGIINPQGNAIAPTISGSIINIENATPGEYIAQVEILTDLPPNCESLYEIDILVEATPSAGMQTNEAIYCNDEPAVINLNDLLEGATTGGTWYNDEGQLIGESLSTLGYAVGSYTFDYIIAGTEYCAEQTSFVEISIADIPMLNINSEGITCFGFDDGIIEVEVSNNNGDIYQYTINDQLADIDDQFSNLTPGTYDINVTDVNGCDNLYSNIIITEPAPISVSLGDDLNVNFDDTLTIQAITNLLENDISDVNWNDLNGSLDNNTLSLIQSFTQDNVLNISIEDENGCIGFDQLNINVEQEEEEIKVYVPNVINPNGSGTNTIFRVFSKDPVLIESLFIMDRWGNKVYSETSSMSDQLQGWDGTFKGTEVSQGVYVYTIQYNNGTDDVILTGDITVLR